MLVPKWSTVYPLVLHVVGCTLSQCSFTEYKCSGSSINEMDKYSPLLRRRILPVSLLYTNSMTCQQQLTRYSLDWIQNNGPQCETCEFVLRELTRLRLDFPDDNSKLQLASNVTWTHTLQKTSRSVCVCVCVCVYIFAFVFVRRVCVICWSLDSPTPKIIAHRHIWNDENALAWKWRTRQQMAICNGFEHLNVTDFSEHFYFKTDM